MKIAKKAYTTEFKELAVKRVKDGQSISSVIKELGLGDQTLRNWVKASAEGKTGSMKSALWQTKYKGKLKSANGSN